MFLSLTFSKKDWASVPLKYSISSLWVAAFPFSPRFGLSMPARILMAVDFPMPFTPSMPTTLPNTGIGRL